MCEREGKFIAHGAFHDEFAGSRKKMMQADISGRSLMMWLLLLLIYMRWWSEERRGSRTVLSINIERLRIGSDEQQMRTKPFEAEIRLLRHKKIIKTENEKTLQSMWLMKIWNVPNVSGWGCQSSSSRKAHLVGDCKRPKAPQGMNSINYFSKAKWTSCCSVFWEAPSMLFSIHKHRLPKYAFMRWKVGCSCLAFYYPSLHVAVYG